MTNLNSCDFEKLLIQSLTSAKTLHAPIPIRVGDAQHGNREISHSGGFNIQPSALAPLLTASSAEKISDLNSLALLLLKSSGNTLSSHVSSTVSQLLKKPFAKNSSMEEANCLIPPTSQLGALGKESDPGKTKRKVIRKQTSFAVTDVKSESSVAEDCSNNKYDACAIERPDDSEIILNSFKASSPTTVLKNYNIKPTELGEDLQEAKYTKNAGNTASEGVRMIGLLTEEERKIKVQRYLEKKRRKGEKSVRYKCRQDLASKRFRFQGRFIKFEDLHKYKGKYIIDYTGRKLIKPMFLITKEKRKW